MSSLTVFKLPNASGADEMLSALQGLQQQKLITILDAATVSWPEGKSKPKTQQLYNLTGAHALSGSFWGLFFGLIFLVPLFGAAFGAAFGALSGWFADIGIDDRFIKEVRAKVTPGTSALFLLSQDAVLDQVSNALKGQQFELIASNLSREQEAKLNEYFSEE